MMILADVTPSQMLSIFGLVCAVGGLIALAAEVWLSASDYLAVRKIRKRKREKGE